MRTGRFHEALESV
jgi:hypothetical protein